MSSQKGSLLIIVGIIILLIFVGGGGYYLGLQKKAIITNQPVQKSSNILTTPKPSLLTEVPANDPNWKLFTHESKAITFKYPLVWFTYNNDFLSEKPFTPGEQDRRKIYNIIEFNKFPDRLSVDYSNSQLFSRMSSLTAPWNEGGEIRTKIVSGVVASGEQYVIYKVIPSETAEAEEFNQVVALILKEETIYKVILDLYDDKGLEIFKEIIPTAVLN